MLERNDEEYGILINIYDFPLGDCTMSGISSKFKVLILANVPGGNICLAEAKEPIVYLHTRRIGQREYQYLSPEKSPSYQYMSGGNFAYSSDSRFPSFYPLSIHDRKER